MSNENSVESGFSSPTPRRSKRGKENNEEKIDTINNKNIKNNKKKSLNNNKKTSNNKKKGFYKNQIKFLFDNIIIIGIILSFVLLISFKYYEEKYSIESYLEDQDTFDYYKILKSNRSDTIKKIKKNYRDLSKLYHPDSNKDCKDCEQKFQEITKAYKTLSDPRLKKAYDKSKGKILKLIESNSINLNRKNFTDFVEKSNDYWIIQIYSDTDSLCLGFSNIWEESYDKYREYIKFGRINISTDRKLIKNKIPFNVKIYPTIFILSPDGSYKLYSNIYNATFKDFQTFILDNYPNYIYDLVYYNKSLKNKDSIISKQSFLDKSNSVILLTNKIKLSLQAKQISCIFNNIYKTYAIKYNEIESISNKSIKNNIIDSLKKLSTNKNEYIKENINLDYFILVNNNNNKIKVIRRISSYNIQNVYFSALKKNFVEINSSNVDAVCSALGLRRTYCYVTFVDNLENEKTLNLLKKMYQYINNSYSKFSEKIEHENDEQFFIQPVYVLKKNLTKKFLKFIHEKAINKYNSFFLDFSTNNYSAINEIKHLSDYSQNSEDVEFLQNIYTDIEILEFDQIPKYCLPFNIECLYNVRNNFINKLYNIFRRTTKIQIILSMLVSYAIFPSYKQYGIIKYFFISFSVIVCIFALNFKELFSLFSS